MVENHNKLEAAFLAGRMDATAERRGVVAEGGEELLRMVLSEADCAALARLSKVLFRTIGLARPARLATPVVSLPLVVGDGGSNGDHGSGR